MSNLKGTMNIEFISHSFKKIPNRTNLKLGPINLPDGVSVGFEGKGRLIYVGEDDAYLHCFIDDTGCYYGIFKSDDDNHIYQRILDLN